MAAARGYGSAHSRALINTCVHRYNGTPAGSMCRTVDRNAQTALILGFPTVGSQLGHSWVTVGSTVGSQLGHSFLVVFRWDSQRTSTFVSD